MRHDDNFPVTARGSFGFQPKRRIRVSSPQVGGAQLPIARQSSDVPKVIHALFCHKATHHWVAIKRKIGPQRCTEKRHVADVDARVLQNVDIGAGRFLSQFAEQLRYRLPVEFVIPENVDHGLCRNCSTDPFQSVVADTHIAGQYDYVRFDRRHAERRELEMKVADDVEAHRV